MEPFDSIEKLITEHGSATIQRSHIALLKDAMAQKDAKIKELEVLLGKIQSERDDYKKQAEAFTHQQPADTCLYCRRPTGVLQRMTDIPGLEIHGLKSGHYKCSDPKCGKTYEKQIKP